MAYSGLYRCSGCSVTFSDPLGWREATVGAIPAQGEAPKELSSGEPESPPGRP